MVDGHTFDHLRRLGGVVFCLKFPLVGVSHGFYNPYDGRASVPILLSGNSTSHALPSIRSSPMYASASVRHPLIIELLKQLLASVETCLLSPNTRYRPSGTTNFVFPGIRGSVFPWLAALKYGSSSFMPSG